jgi:CBS domain-containing protein
MTRDVTTVAPEATLREVAETLVGGRISGLPVVDDSGAVLGVVSEGDIVGKEAGPGPEPSLLGRILHGTPPSKLEARTAAEAMTSPAITVDESAEVAQAARLMTERGINRLPVVDDDGRLAGIVTRADLVRAFLRTDAEIERELREDVVMSTLWIDPTELQITVEGGEVALRGKVESKADAELLELFAARVPGVVGVHSTLRWRIDEPRVPESDPRVPAPPRHR